MAGKNTSKNKKSLRPETSKTAAVTKKPSSPKKASLPGSVKAAIKKSPLAVAAKKLIKKATATSGAKNPVVKAAPKTHPKTSVVGTPKKATVSMQQKKPSAIKKIIKKAALSIQKIARAATTKKATKKPTVVVVKKAPAKTSTQITKTAAPKSSPKKAEKKPVQKKVSKPITPAADQKTQPKAATPTKPVDSQPAKTETAPHIVKTPAAAFRERIIPLPGTFPFLKDRAKLKGPRHFFPSDIPSSYNQTYLCAMPRDPVWIYAYWEISRATLNSIRNLMGNDSFNSSKTILRVLDVTDIAFDGTNAWQFFDIEVNQENGNSYVKIAASGRTYVLEIGRLSSSGIFYLFKRSNTIVVPRAEVSSITDEEWQTVSTDELINMSAMALKGGLGASERIAGITAMNQPYSDINAGLMPSSPMSWASSPGGSGFSSEVSSFSGSSRGSSPMGGGSSPLGGSSPVGGPASLWESSPSMVSRSQPAPQQPITIAAALTAAAATAARKNKNITDTAAIPQQLGASAASQSYPYGLAFINDPKTRLRSPLSRLNLKGLSPAGMAKLITKGSSLSGASAPKNIAPKSSVSKSNSGTTFPAKTTAGTQRHK